MSTLNNIDSVIEKYWKGETSLEEEKSLKEHFANHPEKQGPEQAFFTFLSSEKSKTYTKVVTMPPAKKHSIRWQSVMIKRVLPIAASLIFLFGAVWTFNNNQASSSDNDVVIDDPEVALQITREAFALLNGKVSQSENIIKSNLAYLDKTFIFKKLIPSDANGIN